MANANSPFGFRWRGLGYALTSNAGLSTGYIDVANDTSQYGEGDPLKRLASGAVTAWTATTGVSQLAGIFKSSEYIVTVLGRKVWANFYPGTGVTAGTFGSVTVQYVPCDGSPPSQFVVQSAGAAAIGIADIGQMIDVTSGSTTNGTVTGGYYKSNCTVDQGSLGTQATKPFRIVNLYSNVAIPGVPGTDNTTPNNWVIVEANVYQSTGI